MTEPGRRSPRSMRTRRHVEGLITTHAIATQGRGCRRREYRARRSGWHRAPPIVPVRDQKSLLKKDLTLSTVFRVVSAIALVTLVTPSFTLRAAPLNAPPTLLTAFLPTLPTPSTKRIRP